MAVMIRTFIYSVLMRAVRESSCPSTSGAAQDQCLCLRCFHRHPVDRRQKASDQPHQLLCGAAAEHIDVHVHHVGSHSCNQSEGQRRKHGIIHVPGLPTGTQCHQKKCDKGQQAANPCFGEHQQILVVDGEEKPLSELGG